MKKKLTKKTKPHFLWSVFFMILPVLFSFYLISVSLSIGISSFWPVIVACTSVITVILIFYEKNRGELGKGKFLWSIFFAFLTVGILMGILGVTNLAPFPMTATVSAIIALALLVYEKYQF